MKVKKFFIDKKTIVVFGILLFLAIGSILFTCYNDSFYKKEIVKIQEMSETQIDEVPNMLGIMEKYYLQKITGVYTNGKNKGKLIELEHERTFSSVVTEKYQVGDRVFVKDHQIIGLKRDTLVVTLVWIFVFAIFLIGRFRGLLAILSVIGNTALFYFCLTFFQNGMSLVVLCLLESIFFTVFSLVLSSGWKKKTWVAIISVFLSLTVLLGLIWLLIVITNYGGINFNGMSFLTVPPEGVFFAELIIGGLGAIMDVGITIVSSLEELVEKDPNISFTALRKSGIEIGKDIMSTMMNVLFFTYLCSGLPVFVLALRNGFTLWNYITANFSLELTRFLCGALGIVLTIPISIFIFLKVYRKGKKYE